MFRTSSAQRTLLHVLALCVFTLGPGSACAYFSPEAKKERHLQRGDAYFDELKFREAVLEYRNVLQLDPENAHATERLGLALYEVDEFGEAFPVLQKSTELDPENLDVRLKLGAIYVLGSRLDEARAAAAFVLDKEPKSLDALVLVADAALTPEEAQAALDSLEQVRADHSDRATFHLAIGKLHVKLRDIESAERAYQNAVAAEPDSMDAHVALGNFYVARRDFVRAEQEFKAAVENASVGSPAQLGLANFYVFIGKPEEARRVLRDITDKSPDPMPAWHQVEIDEIEGDDPRRHG